MGLKVNELGPNSLYDRVNKLLVSCEWSDCSFSVRGQKLKAHKLILGVSSPVFEAMFYGPLSSNDDITITDIEPSIFQLLLNYIYTDKLDLNSIEEAYDMLYVSRKYMLENLTEICVAYIQSNMGIDNVVAVLNYPDYMQDNQIMSAALNLFCQHADYLFREYKTFITPTCLQKILKSNNMNISEKDLIKHVFEWTAQYSEHNDKSPEFQTRSDILINHSLMKLLRFSTLSPSENEEIKVYLRKLSLNGGTEVINYLSDIMCANTVYNSQITPRKNLILQWCLCHRAPIRSESPISIEPVNNSIIHTRLKANKSTFINSLIVQSVLSPFQFFHSISNIYQEQFSVSIICESNKKVICSFNFKSDSEYGSNIDVNFIQPVMLKKNVWYKISFTWPELNRFCSYSYAVESRERCYNNSKIEFEFEDLTKNGGSFLKGLKFCM